MRLSELFTKTSKTVPSDEQAINAQLLIQAGYIQKEMAGVYSYLPLGKRVLDKISAIIREEMNEIGALEIQMSTLQPKDLWEKTDRWDDKKVDNWFKTKLVSGHELGIGLTHEEPITNSLIPFVNSYRDLPVYVYQIQTKFRNELRAKSGLMRGREFFMKDLYSFSLDDSDHKKYYEKAAAAYNKIYKRLGLAEIIYRTYAEGGIFSKEFSEEFQALSPVGEDTVYIDEKKKIAVNKEIYSKANLDKLGLKEANLKEARAVEVGNIFHLASTYSDALGLYYLDKNGDKKSIVMGSYGLGISRLMGLIAEHFADKDGLVWPVNIAPFKVILIALGTDEKVTKMAEKVYLELTRSGVEVIYDDRDMRPGEKFAEADLLGIPYRVVISTKTSQSDLLELKARTNNNTELINLDKLITILKPSQS